MRVSINKQYTILIHIINLAKQRQGKHVITTHVSTHLINTPSKHLSYPLLYPLPVTSRNQAEMAEAQMRHLRALMSNVAHDLKAPVACIVAGQYFRSILINPLPTIHFPCDGKPVLFPSPTCSSSFTACCIVACIIVTQTLLSFVKPLRVRVSTSTESFSHVPTGKRQHHPSNNSPIPCNQCLKRIPTLPLTNIFEDSLTHSSSLILVFFNNYTSPTPHSIYASATFMMMAINRSQDFVKSSLNLALVPTITPFPILEALSFACDCVDMTTQQSEKGKGPSRHF